MKSKILPRYIHQETFSVYLFFYLDLHDGTMHCLWASVANSYWCSTVDPWANLTLHLKKTDVSDATVTISSASLRINMIRKSISSQSKNPVPWYIVLRRSWVTRLHVTNLFLKVLLVQGGSLRTVRTTLIRKLCTTSAMTFMK